MNQSNYKGRTISVAFAVDQRFFQKEAPAKEEAIVEQIVADGQTDGKKPENEAAKKVKKSPENAFNTAADLEKKAKAKVIIKSSTDKPTENEAEEQEAPKKKRVKTPEEREKEMEATIFVQNIGFDLSEAEFSSHFKRFGTVRYANVIL